MSETAQLLAGKKAITPLWIVALFVSLTETVLGFAVTQTSAGIQIALTAFVLGFPLLIAGSFFAILWQRPYVFYPPTEFGSQVNVMDYVRAMRQSPALMSQYVEAQAEPLSEKETKAVDLIVEMFVSRLALNGLLYVYAFSLAHSVKRRIVFADLNNLLGSSKDDSYAQGILSATSAVGLVTFRRALEASKLVDPGMASGRWDVEIIDMNEKLRSGLRAGLEERITAEEERYFKERGTSKEWVKAWLDQTIRLMEEYFHSEDRS